MEVKIGEYLMGDFGLKLLSVELGTPEVQTNMQEIPGRSGALDMSEALTGYPTYKNATHKLTFDFRDGSYDEWMSQASSLKGRIHGKRLPVVLGADTHYYDARITVNTEKLNLCYSKVVITLDAAPYKLDISSSLDDWLWDAFNFETGVIRHYVDIKVPADVTVIGDAMPAGCAFECRGTGITVELEGATYRLPSGRSEVPDILILEGENKLHFEGDGLVSIEYRGGRF